MKIYNLLSALLQYPTNKMQKDTREAFQLLEQDTLLHKKTRQKVKKLVDHIAETNLLDLQIKYVELFDSTPSLSLHLFEHVHGDDSSRGQAMADLKGVYSEAGLEMKAGETPDYLPLFLEYMAAISIESAQESLKEIVDLLEIIYQRLSRRETPYAMALLALVELSKLKPNSKKVQDALKLSDGSLPDLEEIDKMWEEEPAFNGAANSAPCPHANTCQKGVSS